MRDIDHEHVLNLIGIAFKANGMPLIVLPFMVNGDLLTYIRTVSNVTTKKELVTYGLQIAKGMKYLANKRITHRDLAARNCMLDFNLRLKVRVK